MYHYTKNYNTKKLYFVVRRLSNVGEAVSKCPLVIVKNLTFSGGVLSILTGGESTSMLLTPSEFIQATTML
jgi:hypothetical protein